MQEVSTVPVGNHEFLQLLRYEPGQYYIPHHDFIHRQLPMPCGPRILTFFLYLSDVPQGGATAFPELRDAEGAPLRIQPRKGMALLWPNVQDGEVRREDWRTRHEAMVVKEGVKFAANAWIHLQEFRAPNKQGCTG